jgi:hypothetical protein
MERKVLIGLLLVVLGFLLVLLFPIMWGAGLFLIFVGIVSFVNLNEDKIEGINYKKMRRRVVNEK